MSQRHRVYALGEDRYWLKAISEAAGETIEVRTVPCPATYVECMELLPQADPGAILLVDTIRGLDMEDTVRKLRRRNWQYVVVVAADPSAKEARAVLQEGAAYDYWEKSYDHQAIRRQITQCLAEIESKRRPERSSPVIE